ncbi:acyl-CoA Delta-9 desaturase-like [Atheta coriaria]|uniref:acyl-CoA Delta-9 desaturase-like n=1 Tax=Dalotia coriaria TaxID=877792 RepID=UPI0031F40AD5
MKQKLLTKSDPELKKTVKVRYVWSNIIVLGVLHLAGLYGMFLKFQNIPADIFMIIYGVISTLGITGGAHRLWAHRSYKANTLAQVILMFMATCTYQNSIYIWARDHRLHHKCSETDADPHNAKRGFFFSHVGWLMMKKHPDVIKKGKTIDMSDLQANKLVMFQHRHYYLLVLLIAAVLPSCFAHYALGASWKVAIFRVTIYRYIISVNLVWCINSLAHLYGNKPYDKNIGPVEQGFMRVVAYGEGFHNYHHTFPQDYKTGEFHNDTRNLTTIMIDCLFWLGWVTDRKTISKNIIDAKCLRSGGNNREINTTKTRKIIKNIKYLTLNIIFLSII